VNLCGLAPGGIVPAGRRALGERMTVECAKKKSNMAGCNCSYDPCSRKGICCECLAYHRRARELPACLFTDEVERTYDRSVERFVRENS
jgi:hypothetical protein